MAYEVAFIFGMFSIAYYLLYLADSFKIEGDNATRALLNGILNMILKLSSVATIIYTSFFLRLVLQDQVQSASVVNILSLYDPYLRFLMYGFGLFFFLLYFLQQFVTLVSNFKIHQANKSTERKYG